MSEAADNERYYTYMLRRMREEDAKMKDQQPPSEFEYVFKKLIEIEKKVDKLIDQQNDGMV